MSFPTTDVTVLAAGSVNLQGGWSTFWSAVSGPAGSLIKFLTVIGVILVVIALVSYAWKKWRHGGEGLGKMAWALIIGAVLCTPNILIPLLLAIADVLINAGISLFKRAT